MSDFELDDVRGLVAEDVIGGLDEVFPAEEGFAVAEPFRDDDMTVTNGRISAVAWTWHGRDTLGFQGFERTGAEVLVRGVTLVEPRTVPDDDGRGERLEVFFHRYVDWMDVIGQLGLSVSGRPTAQERLPDPPP